MTETLKGLLHVQGYRDPIGQITDNDLQMAQLMQLKLLAATEEKAITATRQQVGLPATNHRNPISAYTFRPQPMGMEVSAAQWQPNASATSAPPMLTNDLAGYNTEVTVATGLANNFSAHPTLSGCFANMYDPHGGEEAQSIRCFFSSAEEAIRRAVGKSDLKCLGCGGDHRWMQCPRQQETACRDKARVHLHRFRQPMGRELSRINRPDNSGDNRANTVPPVVTA
eukprot:scaffold132421_cov37-Attheya_sp.AAC.4